jgi:predicted esterase
MNAPGQGPHAGMPVATAGPPPREAALGLVLVHGRGASALDILGLHEVLERNDIAALAPQAYGASWYPASFLAPWAANAEGRDSGVTVLDGLVEHLLSEGLEPARIVVAGFSQGACLACDFVLRRPRPFGALFAFTGGLGGPPGEDWRSWIPDDRPLHGVPVHLASGDPDPHVPWWRVEETGRVLGALGAEIHLDRRVGHGHFIHPDSAAAFRDQVNRIG